MMEGSFTTKTIPEWKSHLIGSFLEFQKVIAIILLYSLPVYQHNLMCWNMKGFTSFQQHNVLFLMYFVLLCFVLVIIGGMLFSISGLKCFLIFSRTKVIKASWMSQWLFLLYENVLDAVGIAEFKLKRWPYKGNISQLHVSEMFMENF